MHYITYIIGVQGPFLDLKVPMMKECRKDNSKQECLILEVHVRQNSWFKSLSGLYFQNIVLTGFDRKLFHCDSIPKGHASVMNIGALSTQTRREVYFLCQFCRTLTRCTPCTDQQIWSVAAIPCPLTKQRCCPLHQVKETCG